VLIEPDLDERRILAMPTAAGRIVRLVHPDGVEACIRGTNINVWSLVQRRRFGLSDAEILADVQGLTTQDLQAAWEYYEAHAA
jgi:uncharacterized protein (DUF433 family)